MMKPARYNFAEIKLPAKDTRKGFLVWAAVCFTGSFATVLLSNVFAAELASFDLAVKTFVGGF